MIWMVRAGRRWSSRLLILAAIAAAAFATAAFFGTAKASAACVRLSNARIDYYVGNSSVVVKQSDSCHDLNEQYSDYPDLARGQYESGGTWFNSSVGDVHLTTGATLRVLVSNVLAGTPMRAKDKEFVGAFTFADYLY
jgi:hypothetical protein